MQPRTCLQTASCRASGLMPLASRVANRLSQESGSAPLARVERTLQHSARTARADVQVHARHGLLGALCALPLGLWPPGQHAAWPAAGSRNQAPRACMGSRHSTPHRGHFVGAPVVDLCLLCQHQVVPQRAREGDRLLDAQLGQVAVQLAGQVLGRRLQRTARSRAWKLTSEMGADT